MNASVDKTGESEEYTYLTVAEWAAQARAYYEEQIRLAVEFALLNEDERIDTNTEEEKFEIKHIDAMYYKWLRANSVSL